MIGGLIIDGVWIDEVDKVKNEVFQFFRSHFSKNQSGFLSGRSDFKGVSESENCFLVEAFLEEEEVKVAVKLWG